MKRFLHAWCLVAALVLSAAGGAVAGRVEMRDGWFYVDGEKFFIKGVCFFENHDVEGEFTRSSLDVMDHEFRKIREAGFNTIRSQLRPEELQLAKKHGLMVMQGANHLFFSSEYEDPEEVAKQVAKTKEISAYSAGHDNILYYIIDNEPQIRDGLYRQGRRSVESFYEKLMQTVKAEDSKAIVSMASYPPAAILDHSMFDCVSLNLYPHSPAKDSLGYEGYAKWFKTRYASDKPFVISEYGWQFLQGEEGFREGVVEMLDDQIAAGACGSFFFTWRTFGREDDGPNMWYGIVPNQAKKNDHLNEPRDVYGDLKQYFQAVVVEPKKGRGYAGRIPIEVCGTERTASVEARLGERSLHLKREGRSWWVGGIDVATNSETIADVEIIARDEDGKELTRKSVPVVLVPASRKLKVSVEGSTGPLTEGTSCDVSVCVVNGEGDVMGALPLILGINQTGRSDWDSETMRGITDTDGVYSFKVDDLVQGFLTVMATVENPAPGVEVIPGAMMRRIDPAMAIVEGLPEIE